jgi:hypothetical protein
MTEPFSKSGLPMSKHNDSLKAQLLMAQIALMFS